MTELLTPTVRRDGEGPTTGAPAQNVVLAATLVGAGVIHFAMVPSHIGESTLEGTGFVLAGWAQVALAVLVLRRFTGATRLAVIGLDVALIAAWAVSRTTGLPWGAHSGEAEDVTFVDGACVALEAAAVLLAAGALRVPRHAFGGVLATVLLTTAAIASPAARDHASGGHSHDEVVAGHVDTEDDLGFAALQNGQMGSHEHPAPVVEPAQLDAATAGELAAQLALTASLVEQFPTIADARAAGYRQAGPFAPGLGIHYSRFEGGLFNSDGDMDPEDIASPFLIYDGTADDARLAGFMYMAYQDTPPEGFAGPLDQWHFHTNTCIVMGPNGIETPFGADLTGITEEMCAAEGGSLIDFTGYMVHVWTVPGYESELGTFSDLNPRLTCPDGTYYTIPTDEIGGRDSTCLDP
jgi:hypothetical protein